MTGNIDKNMEMIDKNMAIVHEANEHTYFQL
jgi:hypothetical protein